MVLGEGRGAEMELEETKELKGDIEESEETDEGEYGL